MSFMISRYMDCEISDVHTDGNMGSFPRSTTFLSNSQRLNDSDGASIPIKFNNEVGKSISHGNFNL